MGTIGSFNLSDTPRRRSLGFLKGVATTHNWMFRPGLDLASFDVELDFMNDADEVVFPLTEASSTFSLPFPNQISFTFTGIVATGIVESATKYTLKLYDGETLLPHGFSGRIVEEARFQFNVTNPEESGPDLEGADYMPTNVEIVTYSGSEFLLAGVSLLGDSPVEGEPPFYEYEYRLNNVGLWFPVFTAASIGSGPLALIDTCDKGGDGDIINIRVRSVYVDGVSSWVEAGIDTAGDDEIIGCS